MDYNTLAFIGRFQPFHNGHKSVVDLALKHSQKVAIILGSHNRPRNARNPLTTQERVEMISAVYPAEIKSGRISFVPQVDHTYNMDRWIAGVQSAVSTVAFTPYTPDPVKIGLIGHAKDASSFYMKSFPTWGSIEAPNLSGLNATHIRDRLFAGQDISEFLPEPVDKLLKGYSDRLKGIIAEHDFIKTYRKQWDASPYPPVFQTVDAVVVQSGHILLVKRKANPGKGLWALPGGFLNTEETLQDATVRELKEETRLAVPEPVLHGSIAKREVFDDPYRSLRGRTITTAFLFRLSDRPDLPKIKGGDDAEKAQWVPLGQLDRQQMYEDHFDIIETMTAI